MPAQTAAQYKTRRKQYQTCDVTRVNIAAALDECEQEEKAGFPKPSLQHMINTMIAESRGSRTRARATTKRKRV